MPAYLLLKSEFIYITIFSGLITGHQALPGYSAGKVLTTLAALLYV